jgi:gluconokinase
MPSLVIMGVAGCGKSLVGHAIAYALGCPLVEGDDHHCAASVAKMRAGTALTDEDRADWLAKLADILAAHHAGGSVLTCSALKRSYRDRLRAAASGLLFVWLRIDAPTALARVTQRAAQHLFPPGLVASQFAALEPPTGEADVLAVNATDTPEQIVTQVLAHLRESSR